MPFSDPSSGFFSPSMPSGGAESIPRLPLQPLPPSTEGINNPSRQPFQAIRAVDYEADKTAGTIAAGAAKSLDTAVTAIDQAFKQNIDHEARSAVQGILNKQIQAGLDTKQELLEEKDSKVKDSSVPMGVTQGIQRMDTLDKARRSGAMSDTNFYMQLQDTVAALKNKYPGYTSLVEDKIKSITGVDTGEALRRSLQADVDALRKAQIEKLDWQTKEIYKNIEYAPADWQKRSFDENMAIIQSKRKEVSETALANAKLNLAEKNGQLDYQLVSSEVSRRVAMGGSQLFNGMVENLEKTTGRKIHQILATGFQNPKEMQDVIGVLTQMEQVYFQKAHAEVYATPTDPNNPGSTLYSKLVANGKQDLAEKIIKDNNPFTKLKEAVGGNDLSLATAQTKLLTYIQDSNAARMLQTYPELDDLGTLQKQMGPTLGPALFQSEQGISFAGNLLNMASRVLNISGKQKFSDTLKSQEEKAKSSGTTTSPSQWAGLIREKAMVLESEGVDRQVQENNYRSVFLDNDPGYLMRKSGNQAMDIFLQFAKPSIASKVESMPDDIKQGYANWIKTNFASLFSRMGDEIRSQAQSSPYFNIQYDPNSKHFVTVPTELGRKYPYQYSNSIRVVNDWVFGKSSLTKLNAGLDTVRPIIEKSGQDWNQYVQTLSMGLQIDNIQKGGMKYEFNAEREFYNNLAKALRQTDEATITLQESKNQPLLDLVVKGEASGNYGALFGVRGTDVSKMTVGEVMVKQKEMIAGGAKSTAAGGPQFISKTLSRLVDKLGISPDAKFDKTLQSQLAEELFKEAGIEDYRSGKLSKSQFIDKLSGIWAALPNSTGKGTYDGDGLNKANIKLSDLMDTLDAIK